MTGLNKVYPNPLQRWFVRLPLVWGRRPPKGSWSPLKWGGQCWRSHLSVSCMQGSGKAEIIKGRRTVQLCNISVVFFLKWVEVWNEELVEHARSRSWSFPILDPSKGNPGGGSQYGHISQQNVFEPARGWKYWPLAVTIVHISIVY